MTENIAVVVEDVDAARTALRWALHNIIRHGDILTLLHVYSPRTERTRRLLRLEGFQLALSFRELCRPFPSINVEIVVTDGDDKGRRIAAAVCEIGASTLVLGLHAGSFLYKLIEGERGVLRCKVVAVKEEDRVSSAAVSVSDMDLWEIQQPSTLSFPVSPPPRKVAYRICPDPSAIIWRSTKPSRRRTM